MSEAAFEHIPGQREAVEAPHDLILKWLAAGVAAAFMK